MLTFPILFLAAFSKNERNKKSLCIGLKGKCNGVFDPFC